MDERKRAGQGRNHFSRCGHPLVLRENLRDLFEYQSLPATSQPHDKQAAAQKSRRGQLRSRTSHSLESHPVREKEEGTACASGRSIFPSCSCRCHGAAGPDLGFAAFEVFEEAERGGPGAIKGMIKGAHTNGHNSLCNGHGN